MSRLAAGIFCPSCEESVDGAVGDTCEVCGDVIIDLREQEQRRRWDEAQRRAAELLGGHVSVGGVGGVGMGEGELRELGGIIVGQMIGDGEGGGGEGDGVWEVRWVDGGVREKKEVAHK